MEAFALPRSCGGNKAEDLALFLTVCCRPGVVKRAGLWALAAGAGAVGAALLCCVYPCQGMLAAFEANRDAASGRPDALAIRSAVLVTAAFESELGAGVSSELSPALSSEA